MFVFPRLHIPALVEITAVCPREVRRLVNNYRPLAFEKFVHFQIGLGVNGVAEHLGDKATGQFLVVNQDALVREVPGDVPERGGGLGVHFKHQPGNVRRFRVGLHHFCADALNSGGFKLKAERGRAAHVKTALAPGIVSVRHPLLNGFPFQLGKHDADVQHGPAHWRGGIKLFRGGIKLFRGGNKLHVVRLKGFHHGGEVQNGAADPVQLVDHHPLNQAPLDVGHQLLEFGAVGVLAGIALVGVLAEVTPSQLVLAKLDLTFNADTVLAVYRLPSVNCIFPNVHLVLLSVSGATKPYTHIIPLVALFHKDASHYTTCARRVLDKDLEKTALNFPLALVLRLGGQDRGQVFQCDRPALKRSRLDLFVIRNSRFCHRSLLYKSVNRCIQFPAVLWGNVKRRQKNRRPLTSPHLWPG